MHSAGPWRGDPAGRVFIQCFTASRLWSLVGESLCSALCLLAKLVADFAGRLPVLFCCLRVMSPPTNCFAVFTGAWVSVGLGRMRSQSTQLFLPLAHELWLPGFLHLPLEVVLFHTSLLGSATVNGTRFEQTVQPTAMRSQHAVAACALLCVVSCWHPNG